MLIEYQIDTVDSRSYENYESHTLQTRTADHILYRFLTSNSNSWKAPNLPRKMTCLAALLSSTVNRFISFQSSFNAVRLVADFWACINLNQIYYIDNDKPNDRLPLLNSSQEVLRNTRDLHIETRNNDVLVHALKQPSGIWSVNTLSLLVGCQFFVWGW